MSQVRSQVGRDIERALTEVDPDGHTEHTQHNRQRRCVSRPRPAGEGLCQVRLLPAMDALLLDATLDAIAASARAAGEQRTPAQIRADAITAMTLQTLRTSQMAAYQPAATWTTSPPGARAGPPAWTTSPPCARPTTASTTPTPAAAVPDWSPAAPTPTKDPETTRPPPTQKPPTPSNQHPSSTTPHPSDEDEAGSLGCYASAALSSLAGTNSPQPSSTRPPRRRSMAASSSGPSGWRAEEKDRSSSQRIGST